MICLGGREKHMHVLGSLAPRKGACTLPKSQKLGSFSSSQSKDMK
jgi:hypothetical protein